VRNGNITQLKRPKTKRWSYLGTPLLKLHCIMCNWCLGNSRHGWGKCPWPSLCVKQFSAVNITGLDTDGQKARDVTTADHEIGGAKQSCRKGDALYTQKQSLKSWHKKWCHQYCQQNFYCQFRLSPNSTWLVTSRHDTFDVSRRACRAVLLDKLDTVKMHGLDTSNVSCRDVTSQVEVGL